MCASIRMWSKPGEGFFICHETWDELNWRVEPPRHWKWYKKLVLQTHMHIIYTLNLFVFVKGPEVTSSTMDALSSTRQYLSIDTIDIWCGPEIFSLWGPLGPLWGHPRPRSPRILKVHSISNLLRSNIFFYFFSYFFLAGHRGPMGSPPPFTIHPGGPTSNNKDGLSWLWILDLIVFGSKTLK